MSTWKTELPLDDNLHIGFRKKNQRVREYWVMWQDTPKGVEDTWVRIQEISEVSNVSVTFGGV